MFRLNQLNTVCFCLIASWGFISTSVNCAACQNQFDSGNYRSSYPPKMQDKGHSVQQDLRLFDIDPFGNRRTENNRNEKKPKDFGFSSILEKDANSNVRSVQPSDSDLQNTVNHDLVAKNPESEITSGRISPSRQIELIDFIHYHLPDLEQPLLLLENSDPDLFQAALVSIDQSMTKLDRLYDSGNQGAYDRALANWKIDAEIKIATVELSFSETPKLVRNLERLIEKQYEMQIQYLKADRDRLLANLNRIEKTIEKLETSASDEIQRNMNVALRAAAKSRKNEVPVIQKPNDGRGKQLMIPGRSSRTNDDFLSPIMQNEFVLPKR